MLETLIIKSCLIPKRTRKRLGSPFLTCRHPRGSCQRAVWLGYFRLPQKSNPLTMAHGARAHWHRPTLLGTILVDLADSGHWLPTQIVCGGHAPDHLGIF